METVGDVLRHIAKLAGQKGLAKPYLVGGAVRDLLGAKTPNDFDITTGNKDVFDLAFATADAFGSKVHQMHSGSRKVRIGNHEYDFSNNYCHPELACDDFLRSETTSRDFTINSILMDLESGKLNDMCGGIQDFQNKTLRCPAAPRISIGSDPARVMRAIKFAAEGYKPTDDLWSAIAEYAPRVSELPHRYAGKLLNAAVRANPEILTELADRNILCHMPQTQELIDTLIKTRRLHHVLPE